MSAVGLGTKAENIDSMIPDEGTPNQWGGFDYDDHRVRTTTDDTDVCVFTFTGNRARLLVANARFGDLVPDLLVAQFVNSLISRGGL